MFEFLKDFSNYSLRKVARDNSKSGIIVSTAYTSDEGYETALIDANGVHPVERYPDKGLAVKGHKRWLDFAHNADGKIVKKLGNWGIVEDTGVLIQAPVR